MKVISAKAFYSAVSLGLALLLGCGQSGEVNAVDAPGAPVQILSSQAGQVPVLPVRVSRSFFSSHVNGTIRVQGQSAETGAVGWSETPAGADRVGCARFSQAGGIEICFELMNDVDSFGVNGREMTEAGVAAYLSDRLGPPCPGVEWVVSLGGASRLPATVSSRAVTSFEVQFNAQAPAGSGCVAQPVRVDFSFQK